MYAAVPMPRFPRVFENLAFSAYVSMPWAQSHLIYWLMRPMTTSYAWPFQG